MSESEEVLKKHIEALPPKFQDAIATVEMKKPLHELYQKYGLKLDQASALETETVLVATGLEPGDDFVDNIVKNVGLSEVEAIAVAHEINDKIFDKIGEALKSGTEYAAPATDNEPTDNEPEEDTLSEIENPKPVGSRIREIRTPYTEKTESGNIIEERYAQGSADKERPASGRVEGESVLGENSAEAAEKPVSVLGSESSQPRGQEEPVDPALDRLKKKTLSEHEEEETSPKTESTGKKYPGGNDPYREPIE